MYTSICFVECIYSKKIRINFHDDHFLKKWFIFVIHAFLK